MRKERMTPEAGKSVSVVHVLLSLIRLPFLSEMHLLQHLTKVRAHHEDTQIRFWLSVPHFVAHLFMLLRV